MLLEGKIDLQMRFWFIRIKLWRTKKGQLLVFSVSVSGKDACGCSHGEGESPRSRISCSSHLSAHTSSFFQVEHSHQAQEICEKQDQESCHSLESTWLVLCCCFHLFLLDFIWFVCSRSWLKAVGTILHHRLGIGYNKELQKEVEQGGRDRIRFPQKAPKSKYSGYRSVMENVYRGCSWQYNSTHWNC